MPMGCMAVEKQSRTLTVWSYAGRHQAKGLLHRTSIAYGLYGCWEKQSRTLTVWSYAGRHQAKGLLHRTSIALTRGLSQYKKPRMDTNTKTRSRPTRRKQRKRGGKRRSGRGGQRRKMRKADRLSWRRWSTTLMWYVYKTSQSSRGMKAVVWQ